MRLYIDPGTGSMLFAILIGLLGTLRYLLRGWFVKLRFLLSGGAKVEKNEKRLPFVIFSDDKRYWTVFEPICRELDSRGIEVNYLTASEDDPVFSCHYPNVHASFLGEGNRAYAQLNFLSADLLLSTTPGLDVYQWKRSKDVKFYVHMLHGPNEVTGYRMFGVDYYDAVLLSGEYQVRDVRALEALRKLPAKELELIGVPYLDEMETRLQNAPPLPAHERTILLAPSWGPSSIFNKYGEKMLSALLETGCHIIVRPHPQSFRSEVDLIERLQQQFPDSSQLEWNRDPDNFEVLRRSDLLISDFSGVIFEFALVFDRPVICADTEFDLSPYDAWWLDTPFWTATALPRVGAILTEENLPMLSSMINSCLTDRSYAESRHAVRNETWQFRGEGASRAADYLCAKLLELQGRNTEA